MSQHPSNSSPLWARNILHTCVGVQPGEKVLIVVDEPLNNVRDVLLHEAAAIGPSELWSYTFPDAARPFRTYPQSLIDMALTMDAVILLLSTLDRLIETPAWVAGRAAILKGTARFATGAWIDQGILDHEMSADYEQIDRETNRLADWLTGRSDVHITTALGTDLRFSTAGREWKRGSGKLRGRGVYGNVPGGEVCIAPLETSANGVLVIDQTLPGMKLTEPVRLVFEHGRVIQIDGGAGANFLRTAIAEAETKPNGSNARTIAELGIGTNPGARLLGNIMTDEKVAGTIHIAIGANDFLGGVTSAPMHIDCVVGAPTVSVDGLSFMENGQNLL
jgi:leucyl aminopeptidase (aminopeptidase T)